MGLSKLLAAVAVTSMVAVPAFAAPANPAGILSIASAPNVRAHTKVRKGSNLAPLAIAAIVVVSAVGVGAIAAAASSGGSDSN